MVCCFFRSLLITIGFFNIFSLRIGWSRCSSLRTTAFKAASLKNADEDVWGILHKEYTRQRTGIELIASENFVSEAVLTALGSCMTNKYSEGQPGARYYGGNQYIDDMERLCQKRAIDLFKLDPTQWAVNVQPYSGSPANFAVYTALLKPHDRIMGLDLPSGGHLTHGYQTNKRKVSATSVYFESMPYRVDKSTGLIDYDELATLAGAFKPKLIIAGASAYPRDWDYARMRTIADSVGAYLLADMAHIAGFVATGLMNSPFAHCDVVTTTTHKSLRGPRAGVIFCRVALKEAVDQAVFPGLQGGPHNNQIAAVAVALKEAQSSSFSEYMKQVQDNAAELARCLQEAKPASVEEKEEGEGGGNRASFGSEEGYTIATGGTCNHIVLWDARSTGLSGAKIEKLLEAVDISVNKNTLVADVSALNPGGVRLGTLAMTTRGVRAKDMRKIADFLHRTVQVGQEIERTKSTATSITTTTNASTCIVAESTSVPSSNSRESVQSPTTQQVSPKPPKKVKEFMDLARRSDFAERLAQIKSEVNAFASELPMPGIAP